MFFSSKKIAYSSSRVYRNRVQKRSKLPNRFIKACRDKVKGRAATLAPPAALKDLLPGASLKGPSLQALLLKDPHRYMGLSLMSAALQCSALGGLSPISRTARFRSPEELLTLPSADSPPSHCAWAAQFAQPFCMQRPS